MDSSQQQGAIVTRQFAAPPETVFDAWLVPATIARWMFAGEEVVRMTADARPGGAFSFVVRRGSMELDHMGEYLTLARPHRLLFTWGVRQDLPSRSQVSIDILPQGTGCELTLTHELEPEWAAHAEAIAGSWRKLLDRLAAVLG